jgi:hypothetical protein
MKTVKIYNRYEILKDKIDSEHGREIDANEYLIEMNKNAGLFSAGQAIPPSRLRGRSNLVAMLDDVGFSR